MEWVAGDGERFHLCIADLLALLIGMGVERAGNLEAGRGGGCCDQFDDGHAIEERASAPVLGDVAEQPVLDLVPLCAAET